MSLIPIHLAASFIVLFFFFSLTTDVNRVSLNPRVPVAQQVYTFNLFSVYHGPGVSVNYYVLFALSRISKTTMSFPVTFRDF